MIRRRLAFASAFLLSVFVACVGDDPSSPVSPAGDAGGASSSSGGDAGGVSSSSSSSGMASSSSGGGPAGVTLDAAYTNGLRAFRTDTQFTLRDVALDANDGLLLVGKAKGAECNGTASAIGVARILSTGTASAQLGATGTACWWDTTAADRFHDGLTVAVLPSGNVIAAGARSLENFDAPDDPAVFVGALTLVELGSDGAAVASVPSETLLLNEPGKHLRPAVLQVGADASFWLSADYVDPRTPGTVSAYGNRWMRTGDTYDRAGQGSFQSALQRVRGVLPRSSTHVSVASGAAAPGLASFTSTGFDQSGNATDSTPELVYPLASGRTAVLHTVLGTSDRTTFVAGVDVDPATGISAAVQLGRVAGTQLDATFGVGSLSRVDGAQLASASRRVAVLDAEGRIVILAADAQNRPTLLRVTGAGQLDATFGEEGKLTVPLPPNAPATLDPRGMLLIDSQQRLLIVFPAPNGYFIERLLPS